MNDRETYKVNYKVALLIIKLYGQGTKSEFDAVFQNLQIFYRLKENV